MSVEVEFFYGVASRYSYLASTQLPLIERATGCRFQWRPLFSGDLLARRGVGPFKQPQPSGQYDWAYRRRDAEEWAVYYDVPFREPPAELKGEKLPRGLALACAAAARLGTVQAYSARLFQAVFADANPRFDRTGLSDYAAELRLNRDEFLQMLDDPATERVLQATTEEAFGRGAFGVPTFFVGDRMYWGNDRLVLLVRFLQSITR